MDANQELDRLAKSFGFEFSTNPLDFARPPGMIAERKLEELKLFLEMRKAAAAVQARQDLLGQAALGDIAPTTEEIKAFRPGRPSVLDLSMPASATPPATDAPAPVLTPSETPEGQRFSQIEDAIRRNAPAVAAAQRSLALHDAGLDESKIASGRLRGGQADEQDYRFQAVKEIADNPDIAPLLRADLVQKKAMLKPQLVKTSMKDGTAIYQHRTPNLSGGYDYTPALDENGAPLTVPAAAGDRPTALQKNAAFLARVLFAGEPEAEQKAVTMLTQLKGKAPIDAWAALTSEVAKMSYGRFARDPQKLHEKTAEIWRVARPLEPIPVAGPAGAPTPGTPAVRPAPASAYRTADEVKAAYKSGKLPREEAMRLLKGFGFE